MLIKDEDIGVVTDTDTAKSGGMSTTMQKSILKSDKEYESKIVGAGFTFQGVLPLIIDSKESPVDFTTEGIKPKMVK